MNIEMSEVKNKLAEAITAHLESLPGCFFEMSIQGEDVVWETCKIEENQKKIEEKSGTEIFFKKSLLAMAEGIFERMQIKTILKTMPKNQFSEIDFSIKQNMKEQQSIIFALKNKELKIYLSKKGKFERELFFDDFF